MRRQRRLTFFGPPCIGPNKQLRDGMPNGGMPNAENGVLLRAECRKLNSTKRMQAATCLSTKGDVDELFKALT